MRLTVFYLVNTKICLYFATMLNPEQKTEVLKEVKICKKQPDYRKVMAFINFENSISFHFRNDKAFYSCIMEYFLLNAFPLLVDRITLNKELEKLDASCAIVNKTININYLNYN